MTDRRVRAVRRRETSPWRARRWTRVGNGPHLVLEGQPWLGTVVKVDRLRVWVDTALNSVSPFPVEDLTFHGRAPS